MNEPVSTATSLQSHRTTALGDEPRLASAPLCQLDPAAFLPPPAAQENLAMRLFARLPFIGRNAYADGDGPGNAACDGATNEPTWHAATTACTVSVLLLLWWGAAALELVPALFLPSPVDVARKFWMVANEGFVDATLAQHAATSVGRVLAALAAALVTAVPLGVAIGLSPRVRAVFDPLIEFYRPVPPLAYLPLIVIWCGIGEASKILLIYLAIFAPLAIATVQGVRRVEPTRVRAAQSLGAGKWQLVRLVILPSAAPDILTGVRIGLGVGWSTLVAAELIAATRGLGFMIQSAAQFLVTDVVVMGIFVIAIVAALFEAALRRLQRKLVPWDGQL